MTFVAFGPATVATEHHAKLNFVALLLEIGKESVQPFEAFASAPYQSLLLLG